jgi:phage tail sheath protein FI
MDRVNVRRLLIAVRREVRKVANKMLFEQSREATIARFNQQVTPILKKIQDQRGLDGFKVAIDTSTTTQADLENKTIRGKVFIIPTKTLEFLSVDFVITNRGNFSQG